MIYSGDPTKVEWQWTSDDQPEEDEQEQKEEL